MRKAVQAEEKRTETDAEESSPTTTAARAATRSTVAINYENLMADLRAERDEDRKRSVLDKDGVRTNREEINQAVTSALTEIDPDYRDALEAHALAIKACYGEIDEAFETHAVASPGQRRYSNAARHLTEKLAVEEQKVRSKVGDRAGMSALAEGIKKDVGVGLTVNFDSPLEVHDLALKQIKALRKKEHRQLFERRGLEWALYASTLEPLVTQLKTELDGGVGPGPRKGEGSEVVNDALVLLEIALSRTVLLLDDHGAPRASEVLKGRIPKRHSRRSTDRTPQVQSDGNGRSTGEPGGTGGPGGGAPAGAASAPAPLPATATDK